MIILLGLGISISVFLILFWFFSNAKSTLKIEDKSAMHKPFSISSKDIETIAGDDLMTAQLDLARAYIETGRKNLAKSILTHVALHGALEQRKEAKQLISIIS